MVAIPESTFNIGSLDSFQWKLSMASSSKECKNLDAPKITVVLGIKNSLGDVTKKSVEMSLSEFQVSSYRHLCLHYQSLVMDQTDIRSN